MTRRKKNVHPDIPKELQKALDAFEGDTLDAIIEQRRKQDFKALRSLVLQGSVVDPNRRQRAIYALGRWGNPATVDDIVALLPSLKETHCITALEALGRLGGAEARNAVESFADDPSPQIRKFVVTALSRIKGAHAKKTLQKMAREDSTDWVRALAGKQLEPR